MTSSPSSHPDFPPSWQVQVLEETPSTNDLARHLPPWSAVRAVRQTAGRGRFGRAFVSDTGGIWLSAVLPSPGGPAVWTGFSLMVGAHLLRLLQALDIPNARLRWPNDLLSGRKKLAGLLLEQPASDKIIVGLGLNVTNGPWLHDPSLEPITTRLSDVLRDIPDLDTLTGQILTALGNAHSAMMTEGLAAAIEELNLHWTPPAPVEVTLNDHSIVTGDFAGLDPEGHLIILVGDGFPRRIDHFQVERLREA